MDTTTLALVIVILLVVAVVAFLIVRQAQSRKLRSRFGPEYDHTLDEVGSRRKAEAALHTREKRVKTFDIRELPSTERERYRAIWRQVQASFVDDPKTAATEADKLLCEVMSARGYPVTDFEQRSADLSVDHPVVAQNYRAAHEIAVRHQRGDAGTEDLRQAMIHHRALFNELVGEAEPTRMAS